MTYYWLKLKECNHGDPYPCEEGCGSPWVIGGKYNYKDKTFSIVGSDYPYDADEFDCIVELKAEEPE